MYNLKRLVSELLGAVIAVAWISWAILAPGNMVGLVIALVITILLGTLSGGLFAEIDYKELIGWVLGAAIAVAWISWAILAPGNMVGLVVALAITILFGTLSGGLIALSKKKPK